MKIKIIGLIVFSIGVFGLANLSHAAYGGEVPVATSGIMNYTNIQNFTASFLLYDASGNFITIWPGGGHGQNYTFPGANGSLDLQSQFSYSFTPGTTYKIAVMQNSPDGFYFNGSGGGGFASCGPTQTFNTCVNFWIVSGGQPGATSTFTIAAAAPPLSPVYPTGTLYDDFTHWTLRATSTIGHVLEYDVQYDTADDLGSGYCGQSPGAIDSATTTVTSVNSLYTLSKATPINPYTWQNVFYSQVYYQYPTTIYAKYCIGDLNTSATTVATTTITMRYGATPTNNGSNAPSLSFQYPTSTGPYPPFINYVLFANGVSSSSVYTINFFEQPAGAQLSTEQQTVTGANILQQGISFTNDFESYNFGNATSVQISATAVISGGGQSSASTTINFTMLTEKQTTASGTINPNGTTTVINPYPTLTNGSIDGGITSTNTFATGAKSNAPLTATFNCPGASGPTDIGGGLYWAGCSFLQLLFVPPSNEVAYFQNSIANLENVPPFVYFFAVNNTIASSTLGTGTTTPLQMTIVDKMNGGTSTLVILQANAASDHYLGQNYQGIGTNVVDLWFNLVLEACIAVVMILIYKLVF